MSADGGRVTPGIPVSFYEHAVRLHARDPQLPLPDGGFPLPDDGQDNHADAPVCSSKEREKALRAVLETLFADGAEVSARTVDAHLAPLGVGRRALVRAAGSLEFPGSPAGLESPPGPEGSPGQESPPGPEGSPGPRAAQDAERVRVIGRELVRAGARRETVWLGLALLDGTARAEDAELIRTVGLLTRCARLALAALASLGALDDLIWLADRLDTRARREAVRVLARHGGTRARDWLRRCEPDPRGFSARNVRELAEAADLPGLVRDHPDADALAHAGHLLCLMDAPNDYEPQLPEYAPAREVVLALSRHASMLTETLPHRAVLASLLNDVRTGPAHLLDWAPGARERVVNELLAALSSAPAPAPAPAAGPTPGPEPALPGPASVPGPGSGLGTALARDVEPEAGALTREDRWRAAWLRRTVDAARRAEARAREAESGACEAETGAPDAGSRARPVLRIDIAVRDPVWAGGPETRVLVDGRPVIAEAFGAGPPRTPEELLDPGLLRATAAPREVRLAEAYCTEGCCGGLYVTVRREGDEVVWDGWSRPNCCARDEARPLPPALRFDAARYDAEIARAEADRSWEWPARSVARRLTESMRERPEVWERWNCALAWVTTHHERRDRVQVSFFFPERPSSWKDLWVQFVWDLDEDGSPPEAQAEAALRQLTAHDPTSFARLCGGSREAAEELGFAGRYGKEG